MRVTNNMITSNTKSNINANKVLVDKYNTQMTTQKKINKPSDDPVIAIRSLRMQTSLSHIDQYLNNNISDANSWLNVTDTAVGLELLSRLREVYPNALVVAGKTYEGDDSTITLTMEELERMEENPEEIFRSFCQEELGQAATEHFLELFRDAVRQVEEETV